MREYTFNYCKGFSCIADKCKHTCCEGWDIPIDKITLKKYRKIFGGTGKIDYKKGCFILSENRRCPYLDGNNLCEIIKEHGEKSLCQVCSDHPRFRNFFKGRTETGLGLCCEEAGRIILSFKDKAEAVALNNGKEKLTSWEKTALGFRSEIISIIENRTLPLEERVNAISSITGFDFNLKPLSFWKDFLDKTERLDNSFSVTLNLLNEPKREYEGFECAYEQLCTYFIYRHVATAFDKRDLYARTAFAVLGYKIIKNLIDAKFYRDNTVDFSDLIEFSRQFSSETEYSDENLNKCFCLLEGLVKV